MAVEVPYTRDHVYAWLVEFKQQDEEDDLRQWMTDKLGDDAQLRVRGETLIDLIMGDMDSYVVELDD